MSLRVGSIAPDFDQQSTFGNIKLYEYLDDSWGLLLFHPRDFASVCTTELGQAALLQSEIDQRQLDQRNVKVLAVSADDLDSHRRWVKDVERAQRVSLNFPIIADADLKVNELYETIQPETHGVAHLAVRSVFFVAPDKRVRAIISYPASTGRNFAEILRVLDSLRLTDQLEVATPADWRPGDDVIWGALSETCSSRGPVSACGLAACAG